MARPIKVLLVDDKKDYCKSLSGVARHKNLQVVFELDWENGEDGSPAFLNENDFDRIVNTNNLFARKIDSNKLKQMLNMNKKTTKTNIEADQFSHF